MTRTQFNIYRLAFDAFIDCANSQAQASQCANSWSQSVAPLMREDPQGQRNGGPICGLYLGFLRQNGAKAPDCLAA